MLEETSDQMTFGRSQMSVYIIFLMHQNRAMGSSAISGWWMKKGEFIVVSYWESQECSQKVCFDSKARAGCGCLISKNGMFVEERIESWRG